jgi:hypothetical protein
MYYSIYNLLVISNTKFLCWGTFCVAKSCVSTQIWQFFDTSLTCCRHVADIPSEVPLPFHLITSHSSAQQFISRVGVILPVLPPHVEMPPIEDWEQKLLGNLAGTVQIDPAKWRLLACFFNWLCRGPREKDDAYKAWVSNN